MALLHCTSHRTGDQEEEAAVDRAKHSATVGTEGLERMVRTAASVECLKEIPCEDLGVTPDIRNEAVNKLRDLILGDPALQCPTDETFLLKFLRARKFDVQRAFKNIEKYFQTRRDNPEMFDALSLHGIPFDVACRTHQLVTVSRMADPKGRGVIMCKSGGWSPDICSLNDFFRTVILHIEHLVLREEFQIKGIVAVLDLKYLSTYHLLHYTPSAFRTFISLAQDVLPVRVKGVYIINNSALFDIFFVIAKPFMKAKMAKRIRLFGYNLEKLQNLVPEDIIPEEHGGKLESYDYDGIKEELTKEDKYFQEISLCGYRPERNEHESTKL